MLSEQSQLIADACYLHSLLAQAEGGTSKALFYARLSVKNCNQAWTILERSQGSSSRTVRKAVPETNETALLESMSDLSISEDQVTENTATPYSSLHTPPFWSLIPRLCRQNIHVSSLFAHHGLLPEARYYLGQAMKVAEAVHAPCFIGQCLGLTGDLLIRQGEPIEGGSLLRQAEDLLSGMPHDQIFAMVQSTLAAYFIKCGESQAGEIALTKAEKTLQQLTSSSFLDSLVHKNPRTEDLDVHMQLLTLEKSVPVRQHPTKQARSVAKTPTSTSMTRPKTSTASAEYLPAIDAIALNHRKGGLLRHRISAVMYGGQIDRAVLLLEDAAAYPCNQKDVVIQALLMSQIRLRQGLGQLVSDPVFCVLRESTISCPSIRPSGDSRRGQSVPQEIKTRTKATPSISQRSKGPVKKMRPRSPSMSKPEVDFLCLAHSSMKDILKLAQQVSSVTTLHEITDVLGRILVMLSATSSSASRNPGSANVLAYVLGL